MTPPLNRPEHRSGGLPLMRLLMALAVLVAGPIVLVVLLSRPSPQQPQPEQQPVTTTSISPAPDAAPPEKPPSSPRRARQRRIAQRQRPSPPPASSRPAPEARWSAEVLAYRLSDYSPWAAGGDTAPGLALPPPVDSRYLVLSLLVASQGQATVVVPVAGDSEHQAGIDLRTETGVLLSAVGVLSDPPDLIAPFHTESLTVKADNQQCEFELVFVIPNSECQMDVRAQDRSISLLRLPAAELPPHNRLGGKWRKLPLQRLRLQYSDSIRSALASAEHRVVSITPDATGAYSVVFPFTEVRTVANPIPGEEPWLPMTLTDGQEERGARARLLAGGDWLVLYIDAAPPTPIVYRRSPF